MLERWKANSKTSYSVRLIECPVCHVDLRNEKPASHLYNEHTPRDFGLTPTVATDGGDPELKSDQPQGVCDVCGRSIAETSDRCADCLRGEEKTTLADFGGDRS